MRFTILAAAMAAAIAASACGSDDKESQLYVISTGGGEATRVGNVPTGVSAPKWFPDSRRIAFISRVAKARW